MDRAVTPKPAEGTLKSDSVISFTGFRKRQEKYFRQKEKIANQFFNQL
jgi:hypothetical protein